MGGELEECGQRILCERHQIRQCLFYLVRGPVGEEGFQESPTDQDPGVENMVAGR